MKEIGRKPPPLAVWLLSRLTRAGERTSVHQDFNEIYEEMKAEYGRAAADRWYWSSVIRSVPMLVVNQFVWGGIMLKNYLKIAARNLRRHKLYSLVNIAGLAVGMACGILILIWVMDELSYDRFNRHHDRIFRVTRQLFNQDGTLNMEIGHTAYPIAPLLLNDFPDIVHAVRLNKMDRTLVNHEESFFEEESLFFAEKDIFDVFTFPLLRGDPRTALARPFTVVLDEPSARRYFGDSDPWGSIIQIDFYGRKIDLTVTGVMKAVPRNSHFHPQILASLETWDALSGRRWNGWGNNRFLTYILVPKSYDIRLIENRLDWFMKKTCPRKEPFPPSASKS